MSRGSKSPSVSSPTSTRRYRGRGARADLSSATDALEKVLALSEGDAGEVSEAIDALERLRDLLEGGVRLVGEVGGMEGMLGEKEREQRTKVEQVERDLVEAKMQRAQLLSVTDEVARDLARAKRELKEGIFKVDDREEDEEEEREVRSDAQKMLKDLKGVEDELERVQAEMRQVAARRAALQEREKAVQEEL